MSHETRARWTLQQRGDLVFAVRKLAEAWWDLAQSIELGTSTARIHQKLTNLTGLAEEAAKLLGEMSTRE